VPLYSPSTHALARIIVTIIIGFVVVGLLVGAKDFMSRPSPVRLAMLCVFGGIAYALAHTMLRAQPIFGTSEGLVARTRKASRTIPWSKIGDVEMPISSFNPVFRTYYLTVKGDPARIYFFAGRRDIERLEQFRRDATIREATRAQ
jgi:hypothetical protein